jgi:UDP-2-acetamido-2,6-beta-L-arabino-hexul-4-ose reductase
MKKILITGAKGFIGSNILSVLQRDKDNKVYTFNRNDNIDILDQALNESDYILHLAGVNRPKSDLEFKESNIDLTQYICNYLEKINKTPKIIFSSSTQIKLDNPYGISKKSAEYILKKYNKITGGDVVIYRLPGVFGKWSRPNYNSVVATFCNNISRGIPVEIIDKNRQLDLVYIDDVVKEMNYELSIDKRTNQFSVPEISNIYSITISNLHKMLVSFSESRDDLFLPNINDKLTKYLYATFLSFHDSSNFAYKLKKREDDRGVLAEFIKSDRIGQIFVSTTKPGKTRGNHYHHTKVEKFLVLKGSALIQFRKINEDKIIDYPVKGSDFKVVDIPPGYTHSIENVGTTDMVVLFWSVEVFNSNKPDTDYFPVQI